MIRAHVHPDGNGLFIAVSLVKILLPGPTSLSSIMRVGHGLQGNDWEPIRSGVAAHPTLLLREEEAKALLAGLAEHFNGATDLKAVQQNFDRETARVDQLLATLCSVAKSLA